MWQVHGVTGSLREWQQLRGEFIPRQSTNQFGVQPEGLRIERILFGEIHHRVASIDALEGERVD